MVDDAILTLDGVDSGKFVVTTTHGTRQFIDFDNKTLVREGAEGREWSDGAGMGFGPITPDGVPFHFWTLQDATVGKRMRADNRTEWRLTSEIQSIERWEDDDRTTG